MSIYLFQSQNIQFIYSKGQHTYTPKAVFLVTHSFKNIILNFENICYCCIDNEPKKGVFYF